MSTENVKRMIFIKFVLTNGEITVDEEQAKAILKSDAQVIPIRDLNGTLTYETINKAFIIRTVKDFEKMRWWNVEQEKLRQEKEAREAEEAFQKLTPEEKEAIKKKEKEQKEILDKKFAEMRESFKIGNK